MQPDQLSTLTARRRQIDAAHARGELSDQAFDAERATLDRAIADWVVARGDGAPDQGVLAKTAPSAGRRPRWLVPGVGVFVLLTAIGGYAWKGSPSLARSDPGMSVATAAPHAGVQHATDGSGFDTMVNGLKARLETTPDDVEGWGMLARSYVALGRVSEAVAAYERAVAVVPNDATLLADYADTLALRNGRSLVGDPEQLIARALTIDANQIKALSLAGTLAFDRHDYAGAIRNWQRALDTQPDHPFAPQLRESVAQARALSGKEGAVTAARISGRVAVASDLASRIAPDDTVFVFARATNGSRMPLAIVQRRASELPFNFTLDDGAAMSPQARLSAATRVIVEARVSKSGQATPQAGDLQGTAGEVAVGTSAVTVSIREVVRP